MLARGRLECAIQSGRKVGSMLFVWETGFHCCRRVYRKELNPRALLSMDLSNLALADITRMLTFNYTCPWP